MMILFRGCPGLIFFCKICFTVHTDCATKFSTFMVRSGKTQQALAAPNTDDPYSLVIASVHDPKRWMNELAKKGLIEFGYHPSRIGMIDTCVA